MVFIQKMHKELIVMWSNGKKLPMLSITRFFPFKMCLASYAFSSKVSAILDFISVLEQIQNSGFRCTLIHSGFELWFREKKSS